MWGCSSVQDAMEFRHRAPSDRVDHPFSERLPVRDAWWSAFLSFPGCSVAREDIVPTAAAAADLLQWYRSVCVFNQHQDKKQSSRTALQPSQYLEATADLSNSSNAGAISSSNPHCQLSLLNCTQDASERGWVYCIKLYDAHVCEEQNIIFSKCPPSKCPHTTSTL